MTKNKGVTIIELLVYMGLLSIFLIVLLDVFVTVLNARLESESTSAIDQDERYILSKLEHDVENADSMSLPANLGDSGTVLRITNGAATETYSLDGSGNLNLASGVGTMKLNSNDTMITSINFTKIGNAGAGNKPTVRVSFTIKSQIVQKSGQATQSIQTTLGTR